MFFRAADGLYEPDSLSTALEIVELLPELKENRHYWTGFFNQNWNGSFYGAMTRVKFDGPWCGDNPNNQDGNEYCVVWRGKDKCFADYPGEYKDVFSAVCVKQD